MNCSQDVVGCTSSTQLTPGFIRSLQTQLNIKIELLDESIKQYTASNIATMKDMQTKWLGIKAMKKETKSCKMIVEDLKKTLHSLEQCNKESSEHILLLKADADSYEKETIAIAKDQQDSLEQTEATWLIYKGKYEQRPLAIARNKEEVELKRVKIQLMVMHYKLAEMNRIIQQRNLLDEKRRNCLVIDCAELCKEARLQEIQFRLALNRQQNLRDKLHQQEATIKHLMEKQKSALTVSRNPAVNISNAKRTPYFTMSQLQRIHLPRIELPSINNGFSKPMPFLNNDYSDNISISSSIFAEFIEPQIPSTAKTTKSVPHQTLNSNQSNDQTLDAAQLVISNYKETAENEISQLACNNVQIDESPAKEVHFEVLKNQEETFKDSAKECSSPRKRPAEKEQLEEENMEYYMEHVDQKKTQIYPNVRDAVVDDLWQQSGEVEKSWPIDQEMLEELESKRPKIRSIEPVNLNLPRRLHVETPAPQDVLSQYLSQADHSNSHFNWKPNDPSNLFSITESHKDGELESVLDSEMSLQSEDMLKRFHTAFSPVRGSKDGYSSPVRKNVSPPQSTSGNSKVDKERTEAHPLLRMSNFGKPAGSADKKESFFLSIF